jgi:hypothetical protein
MYFQPTLTELYAANVATDTIISVGIAIALCATDPKYRLVYEREDCMMDV